MTQEKKRPEANLESMHRIFTVPEAPNSTLGKIDQEISNNLIGFLQENIVAVEKDLSELEQDFQDSVIPEEPIYVSEQADFLLKKIVAQSVHTASPSFVGHMTSALPYFMLPLSKIMMSLNQNLVKIETSRAFTPLERQVVGMIHRLIYQQQDNFYNQWMHDADYSLGNITSGGTVANITALWVARNNTFAPNGSFRGIAQEGVFRAIRHYGYEGAAVIVSQRGHYSLGKAADVLGLGRDFLISIPCDENNKVQLDKLREECARLRREKIKLIAIVGVCGTSETGSIDPLDQLADIAQEEKCHFHVDAAWGGPTLFSQKYRYLLKGIERADSVTIDAHKQLYVPMGAGMVVFKDPATLSGIEHHAEYIIRKGSKDLGSHSLEGSRPGMAMLIHSGLRIMARKGYELLIDLGIEKARAFAGMVQQTSDFELVSEPELNILTYRYVTPALKSRLETLPADIMAQINKRLNELTRHVQKTQRSHGRSFVSRTQLNPVKYNSEPCVVFRVVLANPLSTIEILEGILDEQREIIANSQQAQDEINKINALLAQVNATPPSA